MRFVLQSITCAILEIAGKLGASEQNISSSRARFPRFHSVLFIFFYRFCPNSDHISKYVFIYFGLMAITKIDKIHVFQRLQF